MRYEDGLAELFAAGSASLELMAQAHIGGFSERLPDWLESSERKNSRLSATAFQKLFVALLSGDVATIETSLADADVQELLAYQWPAMKAKLLSPEWLDLVLCMAVDPLILLGRADLVPVIQANSLRRLGAGAHSVITGTAALSFASVGEWDLVLQVLEQERRSSADIDFSRSHEILLWKYAYLHGRVDDVMPVLAQMPFSTEEGTRFIEWRRWDFKAYQIRAGITGVVVPIIEGEQPPGYDEAVAIQIAALAHDPPAANVVRDLRRILKPSSIEIIDADRGFAISSDNLPRVITEAEARIAARRRDYAKLAVLARTPSQDLLLDPPTAVIVALLEEGDWHAAVEIAKDHDPLKQELIEGFDDHRPMQAVDLYTHLAFAAAWKGDDAAAAALLAQAKNIPRTDIAEEDGPMPDHFPRYETLLAGIAEGRLPRKHIYLFISPFSWPF